jgi:hypothetical protein
MTIENIHKWFAEAVPTPTDKSKLVQLGVHFEEVAEMLRALPFADDLTAEYLETLSSRLKTTQPFAELNPDRKELLDALCDQIVTAIGVAYMFNLDIVDGLKEVNDSNWSKFENGKAVFDENGKIKKGAGYFKPDLSKFV